MRKFTRKMTEYAKRYWKPETFGSLTAIAGAYAAAHFTDNEVVRAYAAAFSENIGCYGTMLAEDLPEDYRCAIAARGKYTPYDFARTVRNLALEFGAAEVADSLTLRPLLMGVGMRLTPEKHWLGVTAGKIVSDFIFYGIAAASRETIVPNHKDN